MVFEMQSKNTYSEPGETINDGNLIIYTEKKGNTNIVNLTMDYSDPYDIQNDGLDKSETLTKSAVPYKLLITNAGEKNNKIIINITII